MGLRVQPPQPFWGRVTSTIKCGAATFDLAFGTEAKSVFQSARFDGEKILVPTGQLSFSLLLETLRHSLHIKRAPALYCPFNPTLEHLQLPGLPGFGVVEMSPKGHPFVMGFFAQYSSTGSFATQAKHLAIMALQQIFQGGGSEVVVVGFLTLAIWQ